MIQLIAAIYARIQKFPAAVAVICAHLIAGVLIALGVADAGLHTTPLSLIALMTNNHPLAVASILIVTAFVAAIPFAVAVERGVFTLCIAPQQILLVLHCASATLAIASSHYPDGYVPVGGSYFILIDQIWLLMIAFWHTIEFAEI